MNFYLKGLLSFRPVSNMKKVLNFIISYISVQIVRCNGSFLPYLIKRVSDKKKSLVNNLNICNTIKAKIFCLNCYQIKN